MSEMEAKLNEEGGGATLQVIWGQAAKRPGRGGVDRSLRRKRENIYTLTHSLTHSHLPLLALVFSASASASGVHQDFIEKITKFSF